MRDVLGAFASPVLARYGYTVRFFGNNIDTPPGFSTKISSDLCKASLVDREK